MMPTESPKSQINFHKESISFDFSQADDIAQWIKKIVEAEGKQLVSLNFIFCSDEYLHKINLDYLQHDTLTDVITFPYSTEHIEGDIFISIERIKENATKYDTSFETELYRVIIHGVLHLCGYGDKTSEDQKQMRQKEDACLAKL